MVSPSTSWFDNKATDTRIQAHPRGLIMYAILPDCDGYFDRLIKLSAWTLTGLARETQERVTIPIPDYSGGLTGVQRNTIVNEQTIEYSYTVGLPAGSWLRNKLAPLMREGSVACPFDILVTQECVDECGQYYFWFRDVTIGALVPGDLITLDGTTGIEASLTLTFPEFYVDFFVEANVLRDIEGAINAVSFCDANCPGCAAACQDGWAVGAAGLVEQTSDGFVTSTDHSTALDDALTAAGEVPPLAYTGVYCQGNLTIVVFPTGVAVTRDFGVGWNIIDLGATALSGITVGGSYTFVFGSDGEIFRSRNNITFEQVAAAVTTDDFTAAAWDDQTQRLYLAAAEAGADGAWYLQGENLTEITAEVSGGNPSTGLQSVQVLGPGHVMYGGTTGELYENYDVTDSNCGNPNWVSVASGSVLAIEKIVGNAVRQVVIDAEQGLFRRDLLNERSFKPMSVSGTFTGDFTDIALCSGTNEIYPGANEFIAVTDGGEFVRIAPCDF